MRKSKFSETEIVGILKEAEAGVAVNDLLRTHAAPRVCSLPHRRRVVLVRRGAGVYRLSPDADGGGSWRLGDATAGRPLRGWPVSLFT